MAILVARRKMEGRQAIATICQRFRLIRQQASRFGTLLPTLTSLHWLKRGLRACRQDHGEEVTWRGLVIVAARLRI